MTTKKTIGEMGNDTRILVNVLESRLIKDKAPLVTYKELTAAIQRNVTKEAHGLLRTARRAVERDHSIVLECVPGEGVKICTALPGVLQATKRYFKHKSQRDSQRVIRAASASKDLSNDDRVVINADVSIMGAVTLFMQPKVQRQIEGKVRDNQARELPTAETIRLFSEVK